MHTQIDGRNITITLKTSLIFDADSGGYIVVEQDGPADLNHQIRWGPMPFNLVQEFLRQRMAQIVSTFEQEVKRPRWSRADYERLISPGA